MIIPERVLSTMNKVRKFYCRTFQTGLKIALPFLPYRKPDIVGSVKALPDILHKHRCDRILIITDAGITKLGLIRRLEKVLTLNHISYFIYDKTVANPGRVHSVHQHLSHSRRRHCHGRGSRGETGSDGQYPEASSGRPQDRVLKRQYRACGRVQNFRQLKR